MKKGYAIQPLGLGKYIYDDIEGYLIHWIFLLTPLFVIGYMIFFTNMNSKLLVFVFPVFFMFLIEIISVIFYALKNGVVVYYDENAWDWMGGF